jgi:hypothetical protein
MQSTTGALHPLIFVISPKCFIPHPHQNGSWASSPSRMA